MVIFCVLKFIFVGQKCIMHHLSPPQPPQGALPHSKVHTLPLAPHPSQLAALGACALSSAESSALPIPVSLVNAGTPSAALRAPLKHKIIPDAIRSTATANTGLSARRNTSE